MPAPKQIIKASWIAPITAPPLRDAAVVIADGRIASLGPARDVIAAHPEAQVLDLADSILLPGLINPHTHLELSDRHCGDSPKGSFAHWLLNIRSADQTPAAATRAGIKQCLSFGVTCVGDITQQPDITRPILAASPLRAISFGEVLGLGARRSRFDELLPRALDESHATPRLRIGLSPHAPYTVDLPGLQQCLQLAKDRSLPLATHLAEHRDETAFLQSHSGMFRDLWEQLGSWQEGVPTFPGSPIQMAKTIGLLDYPTLLAHVNYCDDSELALLCRGKASVIYCPRTHRYFSHPPHRWREMLQSGINVAVGTDSCASSPDLNLVDELRLLRQLAPEIPTITLWEMATVRAAKAMGMDDQIGSLSPGMRADLVAFPATGDDPLEDLLLQPHVPRSTWIDGGIVSGSIPR